MKFVSPMRSAFMKSAGHGLFRKFHENAAKISAVSYVTADSVLTSSVFLMEDLQKLQNISLSNPTSAQLQTLAGGFFLLEAASFLLADRYPGFKKLAGGFISAGAISLGASGEGGQSDKALLLTSATILLPGLALVFEDQVRRLSEKINHDTGKGLASTFKNTAKKILNYPVSAALFPQVFGIGAAIASGLTDPQNSHLLYYGLFWALGSAALAFTDEGVKELVRSGKNVPGQRPSLS